MIRPFMTALTAVVALALAVGPAIGSPTVLKNKYSADPQSIECKAGNGDTVGTVIYNGPLKMWPPNHKYQDISIVAEATDPDDGVELFTAGTHDEYTEEGEMNGTGNTGDDVSPATANSSGTGSATTEHSLRSERSGRGVGRTYTLDWDVIFTDDDGDDDYGTVYCGSADLNEDGEPPIDAHADAFLVFVPHDMRCGADWKGGNKGKGGNGQCAAEPEPEPESAE